MAQPGDPGSQEAHGSHEAAVQTTSEPEATTLVTKQAPTNLDPADKIWLLPANSEKFTSLPETPVYDAFYANGKLLVATATGLTVSKDNGSSWRSFTAANQLSETKKTRIAINSRGEPLAGGE